MLTAAMLGLGTCAAETLLVSSDLHLTSDPAACEETFAAIERSAAGCDAVLFLGDDTNNAHAAEHALVIKQLSEIGENTGAAVYAIPGNHDLTRRFGAAEFEERYADFGQSAAFSRDEDSASCAVMTPGGACLLLLDTNACTQAGVVTAAGGLRESTLQWVEATLSGLGPGTPVIACGHHPILPAGTRQTVNSGKLAEVLTRCGVKLYLCGHDHGFVAVSEGPLQQITVGQPHAYPGWIGELTVGEGGMLWRVKPLYEADDPVYLEMENRALRLGETMARGSLAGTKYASDEGAIAWFAACFGLVMRGELTPAACEALLSDPNAAKWREADVRSVVKGWMFGLLENCPQDVREIGIRD